MFALFRLVLVAFVALTIVYISLSLYSRAARREKLEAEWEADQPPLPKDTFVANGLRDYDGSLRRKLILGVYIVPFSVVALIIYLTNFA